jgi:hypothetical protein
LNIIVSGIRFCRKRNLHTTIHQIGVQDKSHSSIIDGMQSRGVSELRNLDHNEFRSASAEDFAVKMQELHNKIKERLKNSNQEYKRRADQHKRELQFEVGDLVMAHIRK